MTAADIAIRVDRLGKEYEIGDREAYVALRDVVARSFSRFLSGARRRAPVGPRRIWALRDVSFAVERGEVLGIIGANGSGKSTLLKILSRITVPTEGHAEIRGRTGTLLEVGTGFHPELTGRENVALSGATLGMKAREIAGKFDEIVAFAEVEPFIDTPVKHYSSGMYMRLAFAVAAHLEPDILFVDEVLAVGDAAFQKKCLRKMGDVAQAGRTVLFVSHNMGAVTSLCARALWLRDGALAALGPAPDIVRGYLADLVREKPGDLAALRLPGYGRDVRYDAIDLLSEDGSNVFFGQALRCRLRVSADVDVRGVSVGASIFNESGLCVGTVFAPGTFDVPAGGQVSLVLTVRDATLAPGWYYAGFSIGRGGPNTGRQDLDIVIGRPSFQVLPLSAAADGIAQWRPGWGNIVFRDASVTYE